MTGFSGDGATDPQERGLAELAKAVGGRQARVTAVRRLRGGLDSSTHAVRVDSYGWVVLKRSLTTRACPLVAEAARLEAVRHTTVPIPVLLAVDGDGRWFGRPALVMTLLPGQAVFHTASGPWIVELAQTLAAIHASALPDPLPAVLQAPHAGLVWRPAPARELRPTARVEALHNVALHLQAGLAQQSLPPRLLHHDFHHGNVLWRAGRISGVLDWNEATTGPAVCDVAYCSVDLALTHGTTAASRFTAAYREITGAKVDDLPQWQALWVANAMRSAPRWATGFQDAGINHLTLPLIRRRLRTFADRVLQTR